METPCKVLLVICIHWSEVTMEFIILKNTEIEFPRCSASEETLITRLSTSVKAQVGATEQEDGTTNAMYSQNLITAIIEDPWTHKSDDHLV